MPINISSILAFNIKYDFRFRNKENAVLEGTGDLNKR